ncbi:MAG TPA: hypothetical protein VII74_09440, partial [Chthoniobacterales bacterium]
EEVSATVHEKGLRGECRVGKREAEEEIEFGSQEARKGTTQRVLPTSSFWFYGFEIYLLGCWSVGKPASWKGR